MQRFIFLLCFTLVVAGCSAPSKPSTSVKQIDVTVLHTNDHHGHYNAFDHGVGGMAARKTLLDDLRAKATKSQRHVLLLSGGDINTGTFESDVQQAEPDFKGMQLLGYDAMAVGNHEWDNSLEVIRKQQGWAKFPFLSANTRYVKTQKRVFEPYVIICLPKEAKDCPVKVGVLGLTTTETARAVMPATVKGIVFTNPVIEAKQVVRELKKKNVDLIMAVTHMGHDGPATNIVGEKVYYDVQLAEQVKDLDVIVGGHTQVALQKPIKVGKTLIVQAKDWGRYVGQLKASYRLEPKGAIRTKMEYKLIPVNPYKKTVVSGEKKYVLPENIKAIPENAEMLAFFESYNDKANEQGNVTVGTLSKTMGGTRDLVRSKFMPIGQWVGRVLRKRTNSDFSMMNAGGIRDSLHQGDVTKRMIHQVHPFGNTVVSVSMTPEQVVEYMALGYENILRARQEQKSEMPNFKGGFPQWSGVQVVVRGGKIEAIRSTGKQPAWLIEVENGKITSSSKSMYRFATINYVAQGGDGYPKLTTGYANFLDSGLPLDLALTQDVEQNSPLDVQAYQQRLSVSPPLVEKNNKIK